MRLREAGARYWDRRAPDTYLHDILRAVDLVEVAVGSRTWEEYGQDAVLRAAVERQFITIGEALAQLLRLEPGLGGGVSHARSFIAFRNILVHGYGEIEDEVVWASAHEDLPVLRREVEALLGEMGALE